MQGSFESWEIEKLRNLIVKEREYTDSKKMRLELSYGWGKII